MRSIVSRPPEHNYVYAVNFSSLNLVKNELVNRTCTTPTTPTTTTPSTIPPSTYPPAPVNGRFLLPYSTSGRWHLGGSSSSCWEDKASYFGPVVRSEGPKPEAQRADNEGVALGEGQLAPAPPLCAPPA